ncbi:transposon I factor [Fusarium oxysporum f. sp. phaseoli]
MSPLRKLTLAHEGSNIERIETIQAYAVPLWHNHVSTVCEADREAAIATSASGRRGLVGMGGTVAHRSFGQTDTVVASYSVTLGSRDD